jgi:O-antigen/teichoic acid export membrane protein
MPADESSSLSPSSTVERIAESPQPVAETSRTGRPAWLVKWGTKGGLALMDQALFAGAQFVLNILLARWLTPDEYGAFAVAYSVYLLGNYVHLALLVEPMIVFGSGRYSKERRKYLGVVLRGHWMLTVPVGLLRFGAGFLVGRLYSQPVEHALYALALALPLILLVALTRRAFYIELRPGHAAAGGAINFCGLIALVVWLHAAGMLSPGTAILAMGVSALPAAGLHLVWLRPQWSGIPEGLTPREVAREHWGYGRWVLAAVFPSWTLTNLYYLALPAWFGLKAAGALKALMNLSMPARHSLVASGALVLPLLVRHRDTGGPRLMRQTVRRITVLFAVGAAIYCPLLWFFRTQIIELLYGGRYLEYSGLPVLLVGLMPMVTVCTVTFSGALSAFERPDRAFWANLSAGALAASLGLWLTASWGVVGALAGYLASYAAFAGVLWLFCRKLWGAGERGRDDCQGSTV